MKQRTRPGFVNKNRRQFDGDRTRIVEAKSRVSIFDAWEKLGLPNPPRRCGVYRSPFREDRNASFSIHHDGQGFTDHATGESGDVVGFIESALRCDTGEAFRTLYRLAGMDSGSPVVRKWPVAPVVAKPSAPPKRGAPHPPLRDPSPSELAALIRLRGLGPSWAGLEIMRRWGLLFAASFNEDESGIPCFVLTDSDRKTALRRRMDGRAFARWNGDTWTPGAGGKGKTWAHVEGGSGPIGLPLLTGLRYDAETVFVVEGSPDAWALFALAWDYFGSERAMRCFSVVVMPSGTSNFTAEQAALVAKDGRRVGIIPQNDRHAKPDAKTDMGEGAALRWAGQLHAAGAHVEIFDLDNEETDFLPPGGKDLCDAVRHAFASAPTGGVRLARDLFYGLPTSENAPFSS